MKLSKNRFSDILRIFLCSILLLSMRGQYAVGQLKNIGDVEGSEKRISEYLVGADSEPERSCLIFKMSKVAIAAKSLDENQQSETLGIQIQDAKAKVLYSSNHEPTTTARFPRRSEMFMLNGKEKGKAYLAPRHDSNSVVLDVKPDEEGRRATWDKAGVFGQLHVELAPYSLPIQNSMGLVGKLSSVDGVTKMWLTQLDLVSEETKDSQLISRWINKEKDVVSVLVFDERQGGLPVSLKEYTVDSNGKQTKEYFSETKTIWKKSLDDEEKWFPHKIESAYNDKNENLHFSVQFEWVQDEQLDDIFSQIKWKDLFVDERSNWYTGISDVVLRSVQKAKLEQR